jgi:predicted O-methyltransferase YrrM
LCALARGRFPSLSSSRRRAQPSAHFSRASVMIFDQLKKRTAQFVFDRYFAPRLSDLVAPQVPIALDYAVDATPRYGYGRQPHPLLYDMLDANTAAYRAILQDVAGEVGMFHAIAAEARDAASAAAPDFDNLYFSGLDALALCEMLRRRNPRLYVELGSGNSTKFARRTIRDYDLRTLIVSLDPAPRADINELCDEVIRQPTEAVDMALFDEIAADDILFIDSSHRSYMNSDVTNIFLEILPRLKPGTLVHFHDILLPYDYPPQWANRWYSEQYLLACHLLGGGSRLRVVLPNAFISQEAELTQILDGLWLHPEMRAIHAHSLALYHGYLGNSFWAEVV